jgi:small-conductance mechanosensitive channel
VFGFFSSWFVASPLDPWTLILAIVLAVAGWIAAGLARRATLRVLRRVPNLADSTSVLVGRIVRYGVLLLTVGIVLSVLGAPLQPLLAATLIVIAIAVLALRGIASNFGAGVIIQLRSVVKVGDEIEVKGHSGVVRETNGRSVILDSPDGRSIRLPNSMLLDNPLVNLTERDLLRSELEVRVHSERTDPEVAELIVSTVATADQVGADPAPQALVVRRGPETTTFRVRIWHDPHLRWEIRSDVVVAIADALDGAGLESVVEWQPSPDPLTPPPAF